MPLTCSCGASLPEDARFCHRCGKPQRDEPIVYEPAPPVVVAAPEVSRVDSPQVDPPQSVTFKNPLALRISLLVASFTTIPLIIPFVQFIVPLAGGFVSALLYQRRSGQSLTTGAGVKLGWMTAILNALLLTVFISLNLAIAGSAIFETLRETIRQQASSPAQQQILQMMNDSRGLAVYVLLVWIILFAFSSLLYMAGGALAAHMYRRKHS